MSATQGNINELLNSLSREGVGANAQAIQSSFSALGRTAAEAVFTPSFFPTANHNSPPESDEQSSRPSLNGG